MRLAITAMTLLVVALLPAIGDRRSAIGQPIADSRQPIADSRQPIADSRPPVEHRVEVVVFGGTASGVIAAVAAARAGKTVLLLEAGQHLGGMVSGGLGATDTGHRGAIGGYSREFFNRVREYYIQKYGQDSPQVKDCSDGFRFEPHLAELIFKEMLKEAKVKVLFGQNRLDAVVKNGSRIDHILTRQADSQVQNRAVAPVFIDASYEGDLLAKAGVKYTLGREGRDQYQESIAGVQQYSKYHQFAVKVPAFDDQKKLLPFIQSEPMGSAGSGDRKIQAYNFRLCLTKKPELRLPFPKPAHYDPKRFALLARYLALKPDLKVGQLMNPVPMPNGKTDTNNNGPFSTDHLGANWDYPDGDYATRERIWKDHIDYNQGFLYFLANDPRVPEKLHQEMQSWGLSKGEFEDSAGWPHQLYVREARRMLGVYFMTQADILDKRTKEDSVGLGSYNTDSHHVQRLVTPDGFALNEGDFQVGVKPYAIPYRSLLPKADQCDNLLVPVCMSASHVAYGTIRMEPVYMILGQASGVAAALAIDDKTTVHKVSIDKLQEKLKAQKAVLSPEGLVKPGKGGTRLDPAKLPGVVVDDTAAMKTGAWVSSASIGPFVGDGYVHDSNQEQGQRRIRFTPKLAKAGRYEVRLFYSPNPNRASNVLVVVHGADEDKMIRVNQKQAPSSGPAHVLGIFAFAAGEAGFVEIRNDGADGFVIADAVQWLPAP